MYSSFLITECGSLTGWPVLSNGTPLSCPHIFVELAATFLAVGGNNFIAPASI